MKVKWSNKDCQAIRTIEFKTAFANLNRTTRNKLVALIRSTRPQADFMDVFSDKRLSFWERKEGGK